jgi:predicted nucleic acid-binding protein
VIVVSDASPIIALSRIGHLELLHALFGEVIVPERVRQEVLVGPGGPELLAAAPWIEVRSVARAELVKRLEQSLDPGEAAAIALAVEIGAGLILIDERLGRAAAVREGLQVTGVVGVLILGRRAELIPRIRPLLDRLVHGANLRLGDDVVREALRLAGEDA